MEQHLIVFDLDGTILPTHKDFPEQTFKTLMKAKEKGHKLMINTARSWNMVRDIYDHLELDTPVGLENGAEIISPYDNNFKSIYTPLSVKMTGAIVRDILNYNEPTTLLIEFEDKVYLFGNPLLPSYFKYRAELSNVIEFDRDNIPEVCASRLIVIKNDPDTLNNYSDIAKKYGDVDTFFLIGETPKKARFSRVMVFNKNADKWYAALKVAKYYNIPKQNIYTFGDEINDIMMTREAHHGYGILGSLAAKTSKNVTEFSCADFGTAKIIEKFLL